MQKETERLLKILILQAVPDCVVPVRTSLDLCGPLWTRLTIRTFGMPNLRRPGFQVKRRADLPLRLAAGTRRCWPSCAYTPSYTCGEVNPGEPGCSASVPDLRQL